MSAVPVLSQTVALLVSAAVALADRDLTVVVGACQASEKNLAYLVVATDNERLQVRVREAGDPCLLQHIDDELQVRVSGLHLAGRQIAVRATLLRSP